MSLWNKMSGGLFSRRMYPAYVEPKGPIPPAPHRPTDEAMLHVAASAIDLARIAIRRLDSERIYNAWSAVLLMACAFKAGQNAEHWAWGKTPEDFLFHRDAPP